MKIWRKAIIAGIAVTFIGANAEASSDESAKVLEKLATLEARVAALETKNQEYKRELEHARSQLRGAQPAKDVRSAQASMPVVAQPSVQVIASPSNLPASWTGLFWGASAGGAATRSRTTSAETYTSLFPSNPPPFVINGLASVNNSGPTNHSGGFLDLYAGWDAQISRAVVGAQIEATIANLDFSSSGTRAYTYFNSAGPTGQTATGDYRPQVAARWLTSALLRAGVLLDENTLLYGLGGWTFAQFEARNLTDNPFFQPIETFWANGPTGGVGLERRLDSNWRVRAEYRYTKFDGVTTQDRFSFTSQTNTQSYARSTQYEQSMQSGRIGFAYAFNPFK